jgi:hypothetical protein
MKIPKAFYFLSILILFGAIVGSYFAFIGKNSVEQALRME